MTSADERILIKQVAQRDQRALEQLYAGYRVRLWEYLWHRLDGNAGLVEEVLQEVFLAVWRSAQQYRGEAQVETWIRRIAHNQALNAQRTLSRRPEGYMVQQADEMATSFIGTKHNLDEEQIVAQLDFRTALQQLSRKHREVLELVFSYGFSCEEVGHILNIPAGTVKSRISQARQQLLQKLHTGNGIRGNS